MTKINLMAKKRNYIPHVHITLFMQTWLITLLIYPVKSQMEMDSKSLKDIHTFFLNHSRTDLQFHDTDDVNMYCL